MKLLAKTLFGLENVLAEEIKELGGLDVEILNRAVAFKGDKYMLYASNLQLRTALSILVPIANFNSRNENDLYKQALKIDWSEHLDLEKTFAISAVTNSTIFSHSQYAAYKVKDAIVDQFRDKTGRRPNIDSKNPDIKINLHIDQFKVTLSLDSSGEPLNRRGYRQDANEAPLNEVLAAGMINMTSWNKSKDFIDPMCGSGTIAIEAALMAYNIAPGKNRDFAFMNWPDFDEKLWNDVKDQAIKNEKDNFEHTIFASDKSKRSIDLITKRNIKRAGIEGKIDVQVKSLEKHDGTTTPSVIIMNPPYDERMREMEINNVYKMIGDNLKHKFEGSDAYVISSNSTALKNVGLKPSSRTKLFNGSLECRFNHFELYAGSKKVKKEEEA